MEKIVFIQVEWILRKETSIGYYKFTDKLENNELGNAKKRLMSELPGRFFTFPAMAGTGEPSRPFAVLSQAQSRVLISL